MESIKVPERRGGYMLKQGRRIAISYRKRYFSLDRGILSNYPSEASSADETVIKQRK